MYLSLLLLPPIIAFEADLSLGHGSCVLRRLVYFYRWLGLQEVSKVQRLQRIEVQNYNEHPSHLIGSAIHFQAKLYYMYRPTFCVLSAMYRTRDSLQAISSSNENANVETSRKKSVTNK